MPTTGVPEVTLARMRSSAEWRFLAVLWTAAPVLAGSWWGLVALRGLLPALFTLAMGAVVGAVDGGASLAGPLTAAGMVFVAMSALDPLHGAVGGDLGDKTGALLHDRLIRASVEPASVAHLERPDLADELARARDFDQGITAPPLSGALPEIGSGFAQIAGGFALIVVLAGYRWWAPLLVGGAWASTHWLLRESAMWKIFSAEGVATEQRHVDYAYRLAVDSPASKEIRMFGLADWVIDRFMTRRRKLTDELYHERRLRQRPLRWSLILVVGANAVVFWSLARDARAGVIDLERLVVFAQAAVGSSLLAFGDFDWWFRGSAQPIPMVMDLAAKMHEAGALHGGSLPEGSLPEGSLRAGSRQPGSPQAGSRPADGLPARDIVFRDVSFAYPTTGVEVLNGFNLTIPAGSSLAIVGQNGAGKTTLAKLICRFYDPQQGAILADGVDLRDMDLSSWRSRVAAVFQDFVRYELSLRDNVAPGGAPDDVILEALERARAGNLASLDTILSRAYEGGTDLSGGQWQRVALARALCALRTGAGVVILDEPTAQLDVRGEMEIFDRILEATRGKTTVLVSHRFSTVRHADRICVLEHGRVVELGSHDELMRAGGRYKTMFELQASRFGEDEQEGTDVLT